MFNRSSKKIETTVFPPEAAKLSDKPEPIGDYTQVKLGDLVRDRISGKCGTATERHYHLNGCEHIVVENEDGTDLITNVQRLALVKSRPEFHRDDETMNGSHVKLGDEVKDKLSGFTGHVIGWAVILYGAHRIGVDPGLKKDGTMGDTTYFDECRLELVKAKKPPQAPAAKRKTAKEKGALPTTAPRQIMRRDIMAR